MRLRRRGRSPRARACCVHRPAAREFSAGDRVILHVVRLLLLMLLIVPAAFALEVPQPTGFVVDTAQMLTPQDATMLEFDSQQIQEAPKVSF